MYRAVVTDLDGFNAWRAAIPRHPGVLFEDAAWAHMQASGETVFCWQDGGRSFLWMCPGCGSTYAGSAGTEAVPGWDNPRWVNSGTPQRPTLTPSLGCRKWRAGDCTGHWWLRDGQLEPA